MSGVAAPWDPPIELTIEQNNGHKGLSDEGHRIYEEWQTQLMAWEARMIERIRKYISAE